MRRIIVTSALIVTVALILFCIVSATLKANKPPAFFAQFETLEEVREFLIYFVTPGEATVADVQAFNAIENYDLTCWDELSLNFISCGAKSSRSGVVFDINYQFSDGILIDIIVTWTYVGL